MRVGLGACVLLVLVIYVQNSIAESPPVIGCRYKKVPGKYECDPSSGTKTIKMELRKEKNGCEPTKTVTRKCRVKDSVCYDVKAVSWSECDQETKQKSKTVSLKTDAGDNCKGFEATKTITRDCRKRKGRKNRRKNKKQRGCKYEKGTWSECDEITKTRTMKMPLKEGDPAVCENEKMKTKSCGRKKKGCKYIRGTWSACVDGKKERKDSLNAEKSRENCQPIRTKSKNCNQNKCKYSYGTWSECVDNKRTRTGSLETGSSTCEQTKTISKPCVRRNGRVNCFFGAWGDFGACSNGVKTKTRQVIAGGDDCQRKAVRTRSCGSG